MRKPTILTVLMLAGAGLAASEAHAESSPCYTPGQPGANYGPEIPLGPNADLPTAPWLKGQTKRLWGETNLAQHTPITPSSSLPVSMLRVTYPHGSINPGHPSAPQGGAGFLLPITAKASAVCLRYRLRFADGFDFAKGGKLPGLYGGEAPSGCAAPKDRRGFSARLMWRKGGAGELYLYTPSDQSRCGTSIGRGAFQWRTGQWMTVVEEIILRPQHGMVRLWIDNAPVITVTELNLAAKTKATEPAPHELGLMFSTFFGGNDSSWASPQTQHADFSDFSVWIAPDMSPAP